MHTARTFLFALQAACFSVSLAHAQAAAPAPAQAAAPHIETVPELRAELTPAQQASYDEAGQLFQQEKYSDALPLSHTLRAARPGGGAILIVQSIYPWGSYKVYNYARIFDTQPAYDEMRERFLHIASGMDKPLSDTVHPVP